jgi:hypothetical protein
MTALFYPIAMKVRARGSDATGIFLREFGASVRASEIAGGWSGRLQVRARPILVTLKGGQMIVGQHGCIAGIAARVPLAGMMISGARAATAPATIRLRRRLVRGTEGGLSVVRTFPPIPPSIELSGPTAPLRRQIAALALCSTDRAMRAQYAPRSRRIAND